MDPLREKVAGGGALVSALPAFAVHPGPADTDVAVVACAGMSVPGIADVARAGELAAWSTWTAPPVRQAGGASR
jgi:hypothetical protein